MSPEGPPITTSSEFRRFPRRYRFSPDLWNGNCDGEGRRNAVSEFMDIKDVQAAKNTILGIARTRYDESIADTAITKGEARRRIRYIRKSLDFSIDKHDGQPRMTGEPYVLHPLIVAFLHATSPDTKVEFMHRAIALGASHDILEDTNTHPSELSRIIGEIETAHSIALSYKLGYFADPTTLQSEVTKIEGLQNPNRWQNALKRWSKINRDDKEFEIQVHRNWISELPLYVGNTKAYDTTHNLDTLLNPEDHDEKLKEKIIRMWRNKLTHTKPYIFPIATGVALKLLRDAFKRAQERKSF